MKIAWFCIPAQGHMNPTLALIREMTASGHEVIYFSLEKYRDKIENVGAKLIACDICGMETADKNMSDRAGKDMCFLTEVIIQTTLYLDDFVSQKIEEIKQILLFTLRSNFNLVQIRFQISIVLWGLP